MSNLQEYFEQNQKQKNLTTYSLKAFWLFLISFGLLVPLFFTDDILQERLTSAKKVQEEISDSWNGQEVFELTPLLSLHSNKADALAKTYSPDELEVFVNLQRQQRSKGLYKAFVGNAFVDVNASFILSKDEFKDYQAQRGTIQLDNSISYFSIDSLKAKNTKLEINGKLIDLKDLRNDGGIIGFDLNLQDQSDLQDKGVEFKVQMRFEFKTANQLDFFFGGVERHIIINSNHTSPSFEKFLPQSYSIDKNGFNANYDLKSSGQERVRIVLHDDSINEYRLIERSIKYAYFFIALTLLTLFLCELVSKKEILLIQYALVGASLVIFYLTLLSFSEHLGFLSAYCISSLCVILPISLYTLSVLGQKSFALLMCAVLLMLYICLLLMLYQSDFALLIGSIIAMFALYLAMYFTRNLNKAKE
ncbi:hypothetical protein CQA38_03450 [Campylobacter sp. MIT 12-5580]|uniref:inner membrane CreD family protein n=1 Tax=Campylobacter sp. MIT 12-5580 TaxID=2040651 RepID=UPI0010F9D317|nr:inner membrane CreD family protein [Campylobacter sp. MIT 12-5580]TKX29833.1 hypothetical protein CQA38_03450 [Campylobacter sp. MIT 12-5580]